MTSNFLEMNWFEVFFDTLETELGYSLFHQLLTASGENSPACFILAALQTQNTESLFYAYDFHKEFSEIEILTPILHRLMGDRQFEGLASIVWQNICDVIQTLYCAIEIAEGSRFCG